MKRIQLKRIQLKRTKGYRKPPGAIVVSRPTIFGNPFSSKHQGKPWAIKMFRLFMAGKWLEVERQLIAVNPGVDFTMRLVQLSMSRKQIVDNLEKLRGRDLCCFCKEGTACHADVLIEFANK